MIQSLLGLLAFIAIAFLLSENKKGVSVKLIVAAMGMQLFLGLLLLKLTWVRQFFLYLNDLVMAISRATGDGTALVFGYLGGGPLPFTESYPGAAFVLAFQSLPLVLVMSALSALLFYWKIIPAMVHFFSMILKKTLGTGGAEGIGISANIFLGMVESPLLIKPYLASMTRSELFTLMTCGMATIAGTVMVLYATILNEAIPEILGHILTASIISAPAAVLISKIMLPETQNVTEGKLSLNLEYKSSMDAITKGTVSGIELLLSIVAMIIVLVALVSLLNMILTLLPLVQDQELTLQRILGWVMAPISWLMGIPWTESLTTGSLMGTKTVLNEFIAYLDLSRIPEGDLTERSRIIISYALCGFANPGSLGIMIGGLGTMAPERRDEIVALGFRSIVAGTLATCMTGAVAGIFL
ncbi:NupC/NupG family nucleoside CNT transporter [Desulfogranum japonicum]|uniref:NupC/NupG family nucleoside CNT transporter n=1 Tax=Desulfogranum japonicum TaxID=231447 RepID=UPI0004016950|nr:nucleoside transporter C-terminal domain-containing protein [Desulfogranum japonicum]